MARSSDSAELNGYMDQGTHLEGELRFRDTFRVDGSISGKVSSENTLIVGETGTVNAEIDCGVVSVRGRVKGRIQAREKIELLAGSHVEGSLAAPRLLIEEGAFFEGDCEMSSARNGADKA